MSPEIWAAIIVGFATVGAAVVESRRRSRRRSKTGLALGLRIVSPLDGSTVSTGGGRLEVTGTYDDLPSGANLYLMTSVPDRGEYWPQVASQPLKTNPMNHTWRGTAYIGDDCRLSVVTAGSGAEALFAYYERAGALSQQWHSIDRLPPDIVFHDSIWLRCRD